MCYEFLQLLIGLNPILKNVYKLKQTGLEMVMIVTIILQS